MSFPAIEPDAFVEVWPGEAQPEISILMPIYRNQPYLHAAVASVLGQRGIVAEIIISDDTSGDGTFETALQAVNDWLGKNGSQHRIIMRQGGERLWRDHLALLVDHAGCDIVCQAHGDDESHPDRARILVAVFRALPKATLLTSESSRMDAGGRATVKEWRVQVDVGFARYDFEQIIHGHNFLVGASLAWRRSAVGRFQRLDRSFAAVSHDRILPFRAALAGDVHLLKAPLIARRDHDLAAHKLMFDEPETNGQFGWSLAWMTHLDAMKRDLECARHATMVTDELYQKLTRAIEQLNTDCTRRLLEGYRLQTRSGRQIAWVDDATLLALRKSRTT